MAEKKNLCAQIPLDLHNRVCEAREQVGLTTAQYIPNLLTEYFEMKENGGNEIMINEKTRTMAFQIGETLFQRIKAHLERETARTGHKLTQRDFVLGIIEEALDEAKREAQDAEAAEGKWGTSNHHKDQHHNRPGPFLGVALADFSKKQRRPFEAVCAHLRPGWHPRAYQDSKTRCRPLCGPV